MAEIRETARRVNPNIMLIPEIYPGIEEEATRVGADVYQMYGVVDAIAHEYEFGGGEHMAATRTQLDWFLYQAGMLTFRAFAEGKATWILNYSWDGQKGVAASDAMKNLAASQVMAGANFWDAAGHVMSGSNDPATRTEIFQWIEKHEKVLYRPRTPMQPVGVYFSPKSRDYAAKEFLPSYRGMLVLLLQRHREFAVVTPRTLKDFRGRILALPNVAVLDEEEKQELAAFVKKGGKLVVTGKNATGLRGEPQVLEFSNCPAKAYLEGLEKDFADGASRVPLALLDALDVSADVRIAASPYVAANVAAVDGKTTIFFANFAGLLPDKVAVPAAAQDVEVSVPAGKGDTATFLPFLGEEQTVKGRLSEGRMIFVFAGDRARRGRADRARTIGSEWPSEDYGRQTKKGWNASPTREAWKNRDATLSSALAASGRQRPAFPHRSGEPRRKTCGHLLDLLGKSLCAGSGNGAGRPRRQPPLY